MQRRHDIDALRALAFGLLILYHLAMLYVTDWGWHLKSSYLTEALQMPMLMMNRWRMDLIFLISGISTAFLMKNSRVASFLKDRTWRLMLPLVFGMLVIVPIQPYAQGVANSLVEPGFIQFLTRYYTGATWPEKAFDGWEHGFTWNHLWYLAYLWCYTLVLALLLPLLNSNPGQRLRKAFTGLRGLPMLLLPALPLFIYTITLQARFPNTNNLTHDWYAHPVYFTIFLYGWCLANSDTVWAELAALRKRALGLVLGSGAVYLTLVRLYWGVDDVSTEAQWLIWAARNVYVWAVLCAILGWGHAYLNRPMRWLPWATQAVYPWYVLHQSLIVLLAYWLVPLKIGPVAEPLLVGVGTVLGCWMLTSGLIQRVGWVRPLFGLKGRAARAIYGAPRST
ncbi:MAG: acyltransferase [Rhodoferax sp.]|nr:acyltransferase [Rhodoferax sp.]